jgi:zinc and cadmium transporter
MHPNSTSLLFGLLAALANTFGGLIIIQTHWHREYLKYFLALGSGFMLAAAFLEMIPTSFELFHGSPAFVLSGYLIVHLFEHGLSPHFHFGEEVHTKEMLNPRVGISALIGLMSHSFFDGVAIASGFILSYRLGIIVFVAVILHKLPEGFRKGEVVFPPGSRSIGISHDCGGTHDGHCQRAGELRTSPVSRCHDLRRSIGFDAAG